MTDRHKRDGGEVELLPLPLPNGDYCNPYDAEQMETYARANVERALAESLAELGRVIRERDETFRLMLDRATKAEARAERLAALLHEAWGHVPSGTLADQIHVALEQEPQE